MMEHELHKYNVFLHLFVYVFTKKGQGHKSACSWRITLLCVALWHQLGSGNRINYVHLFVLTCMI